MSQENLNGHNVEPQHPLTPEQLRPLFLGMNTVYPTADGGRKKRAYLDSAATGLALAPAYDVVHAFLAHYSNAHSTAHFAAEISTNSLKWASQRILKFLGASSDEYVLAFVGAGTTAAVNRFAERMARARPHANRVLVSLMEHHSNDLPHRRFANVEHLPLKGTEPSLGQLSLDELDKTLQTKGSDVRYVAVSGASNVTGVLNPFHEVAEIAHHYEVPVLVDGAQLTGHVPVRLSGGNSPSVDAFAFSGHKIYAPMSPGVLVTRRSLLEEVHPSELGGGAVSKVSTSSFELANDPSEREHAGTPNIAGAVLLASVLDLLDRVGMKRIAEHGAALVEHAWTELSSIPGIKLYGSPDLAGVPRSPVVAFNLANIPHGLTAAILNDYFGVAVRNGCFCAQPYVRVLVRRELWDLGGNEADEAQVVETHRGMVRASFGCYTNRQDVDRLVEALQEVLARPSYYSQHYDHIGAGRFQHKSFRPSAISLFDVPTALSEVWRKASAPNTTAPPVPEGQRPSSEADAGSAPEIQA